MKKLACSIIMIVSVIISSYINMVKAANTPHLTYTSHVQDIGWQDYVQEGEQSGTSGQSLRLEGIKINLDNAGIGGSIEYCTHVQNISWQSFVGNNEVAGTSGQSLRLEAIRIRLTGEIANQYDIYYRVHAQEFGWLDWAKNGGESGTGGYSYRLEAIEIKLVKKGLPAPGQEAVTYHDATKEPYVAYSTQVQDIGWQDTLMNGKTAGTQGKRLRLEAIKLDINHNIMGASIQYKTHVQNIGWQDWKRDNELSGTVGQRLKVRSNSN